MGLARSVYALSFVLGLAVFGALWIGGAAYSLQRTRALPPIDLSYSTYIAGLADEGDARGVIDQMRLAIDLDVERGHEVVEQLLLYAQRVGDRDGALAALRWRAREHAGHVRPHLRLASVLLDAPEPSEEVLAEAERHGRAALALDPDSPRAQLEIGSVFAYRGQPEQAREHWERALSLAPEARDVFSGVVRRRHDVRDWPGGESAGAP